MSSIKKQQKINPSWPPPADMWHGETTCQEGRQMRERDSTSLQSQRHLSKHEGSPCEDSCCSLMSSNEHGHQVIPQLHPPSNNSQSPTGTTVMTSVVFAVTFTPVPNIPLVKLTNLINLHDNSLSNEE